jgi:2-polyprenyl-3-methyl-5-hydroxy-6-metoxy-1,4-benzoquinol methylase
VTRELFGLSGRPPRIGILVVAYNAALTLQAVLDRIPAEFLEKTTKIFVCDDHSHDSTYLVGLGYKQLAGNLPIEVIRNDKNLGYGGNQKLGYRLAIEHDLDIVVMLHGDGQYAPECLQDVVGPLERGEADAVMGSRMMESGAARRGGMPLYKYLGNRVLTRFENAMLGTSLTEFHSGYRAYSVRALRSIPFEKNSDGFNFDTQIIVQLHAAGKRILEVPIPTYYGDEICYVNGMQYARDVCMDVLKYRLHTLGLSAGSENFDADPDYEFKEDPQSSHGNVLRWLKDYPPSRVLDLGCSGGHLAERAATYGHTVVGVDLFEVPGVTERVSRFVQADLDLGIPESVGRDFDIVLAADVVEHVRHPDHILSQIGDLLAPNGTLIISVPNFAHWYPRARVVTGTFDYDERGILDKTHLRFFTRKSFANLIAAEQFQVTRRQVTGLPLGRLFGKGRVARLVGMLDRALVAVRPTLFGYQFVYELRSSRAAEPAAEATSAGALVEAG